MDLNLFLMLCLDKIMHLVLLGWSQMLGRSQRAFDLGGKDRTRVFPASLSGPDSTQNIKPQ